jgi:hypothetical protein
MLTPSLSPRELQRLCQHMLDSSNNNLASTNHASSGRASFASDMHPGGGLQIQDRTWRFKKFRGCFIGDQAVNWILDYVEHLRRIQPAAQGGACREEWANCSACQSHANWIARRKRGRTARKVDLAGGGEGSTAEGLDQSSTEQEESTTASRLPEHVTSREDAVRVLNTLVAGGLIEHVVQEHAFKDTKLFYRFTPRVSTLVVDPVGSSTRSSSSDTAERRSGEGGKEEGKAVGFVASKPVQENQETQPRFDDFLFPTVVQLAARHQQLMIAELPDFQHFCLATTELQVIDLSTLADECADHDACTAFWLNLYNCLALHAFFCLKPMGDASVVEQYRFFKVGWEY